MANRVKRKKNPVKKPSGTASFKSEKEQKIDLRSLARDERTWKILGVVFIALALVLFISFGSYLFTWKQDQSIARQGLTSVISGENHAANLLGRFGAVISHLFIFNGFGIAAFLICTFFFVVGVNLLFRTRVFSIWRNLKYVTVGLLVLSVSLSFLFSDSDFPFGGAVGNFINNKLTGAVGTIGTGVILLILAIAYIIWQFNPAFNLAGKAARNAGKEMIPGSEEGFASEKTVNELYAVKESGQATGETKTGAKLIIQYPDEAKHDLELVEKEEEEMETPTPETEIVQDLMHTHEDRKQEQELGTKDIIQKTKPASSLELEIKGTGRETEEEKTVAENLQPYEPTLDLRDYKYPTLELLETHGSERIVQDMNELENHKNQIISTLSNYQIEIQKISATVGPTVTLYEIVPAPGIRISKIKNLEDDIALSLAALGIRIIAPIPGKGTIGIEVPNVRKSVVNMRTLLESEKFQYNNYSLPIAIGKKIDNENYIVDLTSMPHLLMAGATGQGKSVGINAILVSLLYKKHPSQLKLVLIDPKKVELSLYKVIEKHFLAKLPGEEDAIITDTKKVIYTLNALCIEMDNRYDLLKEAGARNIREYNEKFVRRKLNPLKGHQYLPFIVLVIDEFADLIMTAGKETELPLSRLAQLARAVGIHLIIATQRPSVNIITGTIKANFPSRIAFKVTSKIDSRTILDTGGAEQLIGKGDMLISHHGEMIRLQCAFVDTPEVEKVVEFIGDQRGYPEAFLLPEYIDEKDMEARDVDLGDKDPLFEDAARLIVQNQIGSTSLLQRRMKLGYNRAGRLMDQLEIAGIVGPSQGSKAREVLIKNEMELQQHLSLL